MAFLPLNISRKKQINVVIVGGGYAGLAALTNVLQFAPDTRVTLIDPRQQHLKITHLHETFRYPLADLLVSFADIGKRFECRYLQARVELEPENLSAYQERKQLIIDGEVLNFDYLIIASGCNYADSDTTAGTNEVLSLYDFTRTGAAELLLHRLNSRSPIQHISVVGGGATGIQFLFELQQFLNRIRRKATLRLIHSTAHVLNQFPDGFGTYVKFRLDELGIAIYPDTYYREQQSGKILLTDKRNNYPFELPSDLTLLFLGKQQQNLLTANAFGQMIVNGTLLPNVFSAGDCSRYQSIGSNAWSAQSAVRKGKLVARNILRHAGFPGLLEPYLHQDLGYVVSLGTADAVGWLVAQGNIVTGIPALAIKEIVEVQYDLLLTGVDTFLV
ncbi:MAG: FAD-dependent oxidoreductase [Nitrosomonas sp.]|nr:MAG: FAD-dependent oxidoreductase [Nitrosomonas sp.]